MAPRKSSRVVKKSTKVQEDSDYGSDEAGQQAEEEEEEYQAPVKKKSKTSAKKSGSASGGGRGRGKKSKLEVFNAMPLDVLVEIMGKLDLKTLLSMSRTCSIFRRVLHSDGGSSAWKSARRNIGLGDLKRPDVKEWELAQLLYDGTCVACGKTRAVTVDWVLFVRGCANCMRANSKRRELLNEGAYHKLVWKCVPKSLWSPPYSDSEPMEFFWTPMLTRVTNHLNSLKDKPEELKAFIKSRKNIQQQARADKTMIEAHVRTSKMVDINAKEDKKLTRFNKIKDKLRLEGYDEKDLASRSLEVHHEVNNARDLSDNVWKRIKPILTTMLDEERSRRLANEALQRQRARAFALKFFYQQIETSLPPSSTSDLRTYYPPFANFLSLPSVQPLYLPEHYVPTAEDLAAAKPQILAEIQQFSLELQKAFHSNLLSAYTSLDPDFNHNDLNPTSCLSAIKCPSGSYCQTYSTFPSILEHARLCCGDSRVITQDSLSTTPLQIKTLRQILEAVNQEEEVGKKLNENSSVTELYALGNSFACETCEVKKGQTGGAIGVATWAPAQVYKTKEISWVVLLNHIKIQHAEGEVSIKYTKPAPPPPADSETLKKDEDEGTNEGDNVVDAQS